MRSLAVLGSCIASLVALASSAQAAVVVNPVTASVTFAGAGGSLGSASAINRSGGPADIGTVIGAVGSNASIRGRWTAQMVGAAGSGSNGGNVYSVVVTIGSSKKVGPFARDYQDVVLASGDQIGGSSVTSASIGFGVGGGGLMFDDFGGVNQILIDNSGLYGDAGYSMRVDPNFAPYGVTGLPSLMSTYAMVAGDGSVGFSTTFNASSLWVAPDDVSGLFGGNLAANEVRGFASQFFVEVVAVPAPGAMALLGLAGVVGRCRR
ncbi:MAG: hypothetical protein NTU45_05465 [Planctomycetota bacterium]|nr:hypothetical protein [Planctomycetota bacterium]